MRYAPRLVAAAVAGMALVLSTDACAFGKKRAIPVDSMMDAVLANDATGIVEGCGAQPIVGFTYCRVTEGVAADAALSFIGPPAKCEDKSSCVFIKVSNQSGQIVWGGSIPKGQTRVAIPWKTLLGSDSFQIANRGQWSWIVEVHWADADNHDRISRAQGDIFLRVLRAGYTPLDHVEADPAFAWTWIEGGLVYRMTTGLRAYVGKSQ